MSESGRHTPRDVPEAGGTDGQGLYIELDGWEGPLDLLLDLARRQKVDLRALSILELVDQYLRYIRRAETIRLDLAADYLVMAAWLAHLKFALLLPREQDEEDPDDLAHRLEERLRRLAVMREAGNQLMARDRIGHDVFLRRRPEGLFIERRNAWRGDLFDLLRAYRAVRVRAMLPPHTVAQRRVISLEQAIEHLPARLPASTGWSRLETLLTGLEMAEDSLLRRSALASSFAAALELARTGRVQIRQDSASAALQLRHHA